MKFACKKGDTSTLRKVYSDNKEICYGIVGTIGDLLKAKILTYADYPKNSWCFISANEAIAKTRFGATREVATEKIYNNYNAELGSLPQQREF